jgi:Tol biopolymer transport system component
MGMKGWVRRTCLAGEFLAVLVSGCGEGTLVPPSGTVSIQLAATNSGDQQTGTVGATLPQPLRVVVRRGSEAARGVSVSWNAFQGSLSASSTTTDDAGIASVSWTLGQGAGYQSATASINDAIQTTDSTARSASFTAQANPGPASQLRFSLNPTNTFPNRPVKPAVTVFEADAFGNPTSSATTITVALSVHSGTGVLSGTTRVDAAGGVATFSDLSIDQTGTGYALNASASGLTGATSSAFDVVTPGTGQIAFSSSRDGNNEIYVMNADGSSQVNLTNNAASDASPAWSPDGTRIVFSSNRDGNGEIYMMNADGSGQVDLTNDPATDRGPAWSPDGSKIAFTSNRDGNDEIYVMNIDGSSQVNLTHDPAADQAPDWFPDGAKIAFSRGANIYLMNADGSDTTRLTNGSDPAWSRDGAKIAGTRPSPPPPGCHMCRPVSRIVEMNADASSLVVLTSGREPAWSSDGKIAFSSGTEIFVMNADGSGMVRLTYNAANAGPAWSP